MPNGRKIDLSIAERAERIREGSTSPFRGPGQPCPIALIMSQMTEEDIETLERELWRPHTDRGRLTAPELTQILEEEGYTLSKIAVERHRRQECRCFKRRSQEPSTS